MVPILIPQRGVRSAHRVECVRAMGPIVFAVEGRTAPAIKAGIAAVELERVAVPSAACVVPVVPLAASAGHCSRGDVSIRFSSVDAEYVRRVDFAQDTVLNVLNVGEETAVEM